MALPAFHGALWKPRKVLQVPNITCMIRKLAMAEQLYHHQPLMRSASGRKYSWGRSGHLAGAAHQEKVQLRGHKRQHMMRQYGSQG